MKYEIMLHNTADGKCGFFSVILKVIIINYKKPLGIHKIKKMYII